jgi:hypothetical protein
MLLLYVPLLLATHSNIESACEVFYWLNIGALALYVFAIWRLARWLPNSKGTLGGIALVYLVLATGVLALVSGNRALSDRWGRISFTERRLGTPFQSDYSNDAEEQGIEDRLVSKARALTM